MSRGVGAVVLVALALGLATISARVQAAPAVVAPSLAGGAARAPADGAARFVLIVGVNRSVDADLPQLRYADDDAARYQ